MSSLVQGSLLILGAGVAFMNVFNSRVSSHVGYLEATFIFLAVGFVSLAILIASGLAPGDLSMVKEVPKFYLLAGVINVAVVGGTAVAFKAFGPGRAMVAILTGQLVVSQLMDQFGILTEQRPLSPVKIFGVALLLIGMYIVLNN